VVDNTLRLASDEMNEAIIRHMKNQYHLRIGELTAEKIKIEFAIAHEDCEEKEFEVKGVDFQNGLPRQVVLSNRIFLEALSGVLSAITNAIVATFDQLPPELAGDIIDRGVILTGGGSLIRGLDEHLRERLNVPVNRAPNALYCVAEGTRKILESFDRYRTILLN
jgi:rod shape-determining protein MreB